MSTESDELVLYLENEDYAELCIIVGSWNLRFDFLPTDLATTIQLRDFRETENDE